MIRRVFRRVHITNPETLWKRYLLGLVLVFATIFSAHYASISAIREAEDHRETSLISTRQVILSQRILFLMREAETHPSEEIEARLRTAIDLFATSHDWLMARAGMTPELQHLYFDDETFPLDYFSRRFVTTARYSLTATGQVKANMQNQMVALGQQDLLSALYTASELYDARSMAHSRWLQRIEATALGLALVVLLIEGALIFLPAQLSVSRTIRRLDRRRNQLLASFEALRVRNTELTAARNNLAHAANHDPLTGLLNRRALYSHLAALQKTGGGDVALSLMKIDLDKFKAVNDSLGHKAGDEVLVEVARVLLSHARTDDLAARIGGDEFVIVIRAPQSIDAIEQLGNRLIDAISQPMQLSAGQGEVGASVGFTMATSKGVTPDQLLIEADLALYKAKRSGRGQTCAYSDDLRTELDRRKTLFAQIDRALAFDQFEPHMQPQLCLETGRISGCEVLARWRHPERGIIPPATFIAAAEEAGLIRQIDLIMVEKGLNLLERFRAEGMEIPAISVNASPATLRDPHLSDRLLQEVLTRGMRPADLTVEVLENTLIEADDDEAIRTVENLTRAGFPVLLDDFGTGYASMSNLSRLRISGIKLDRSLIDPIPNTRAESIISALVALSRSLSMRVVAEGVETQKDISAVSALGCDIAQGFAIGHPMEEAAFRAWYARFTGETGTRKA
ncbi:EAL domain-containing protein [uncultured Roseobacter sp.]|uniref:putative bifunctional diguanylate cyclase/phosphodiesterase n=1 Tax=uncultured Roseobacter sp. TaxID=114847 RepID=UPI002613845D|nr:EAL domain-containing protein [uncultured Roseobacter sp.]